MNDIRIWTAAAIGCVMGGLVGWWLTRRYDLEELDEANQSIEFLKRHYDALVDEIGDVVRKKIKIETELKNWKQACYELLEQDQYDTIRELVHVREIVSTGHEQGWPEEKITEEINRYSDENRAQHLSESYRSETFDEVDLPQPEEEVEEDPTDYPPPYRIDVEEYLSNTEYDKIDITYFAGDDTLCDTDDDIFPKERIGGDEMLESFQEEDGSIFVRDEKRKIDYEILWDELSYQVAVLGRFDPKNDQDFDEEEME